MAFSEDFKINNKTITIAAGDITYETTDAIVNAAKSSLSGGGGADGAIHRSAGPELTEYCKNLGSCSAGSAKITPGFNLSAEYIIHAVGPVYKDGKSGEKELLKSAYLSSLKLADSYSLKSISFPSISTGHYRYPEKEAADIAVKTAAEFLKGDTSIEHVKFIIYGGNFDYMYDALKKYTD